MKMSLVGRVTPAATSVREPIDMVFMNVFYDQCVAMAGIFRSTLE